MTAERKQNVNTREFFFLSLMLKVLVSILTECHSVLLAVLRHPRLQLRFGFEMKVKKTKQKLLGSTAICLKI